MMDPTAEVVWNGFCRPFHDCVLSFVQHLDTLLVGTLLPWPAAKKEWGYGLPPG